MKGVQYAMKTATYDISGLTCPSCADDLSGIITGLSGVSDVKVLFGLGKVRVSYEETMVDTATIRQTIAKAGYKVKAGASS